MSKIKRLEAIGFVYVGDWKASDSPDGILEWSPTNECPSTENVLYAFVIDDDVSFFFYFVALHEFTAFDDAIAVRTKGLLFDAAAANSVDLVETDPLRPCRRKQAHRNSDETKRDVTLPNC